MDHTDTWWITQTHTLFGFSQCLPNALFKIPGSHPLSYIISLYYFWLHWVFMVMLGGGELSSCGTACVTLVLQAGIKRASPALEGGFLPTRPLGSSPRGHVSLGSCWLWPCFRIPLFWLTWPVFRGTRQVYCQTTTLLKFVWYFFSQRDSGYRFWWGNKVKLKPTDIKCLFSSHHVSVISTWLCTVAAALHHPAAVAFVIPFSWKEDYYVQFCPSSFRVMCLH